MDDVLLEVKIHPKDVVAIPTDYNQQKMRVCEYTVLAVNDSGMINRACYDPENAQDEGDQWAQDDGYACGAEDDGDSEGCDGNCDCCASVQASSDPVDTRENWKTQQRDSHGRFLPKS